MSSFWHQENQNVNARFTNRKHCLPALRNKKKIVPINNTKKNLADSRFFHSKTLTPMNSKVAFICREFISSGFFQNTYTVNGILDISEAKLETKIMKIFHEVKLPDLFPDNDFSRFSSRLEENATSYESIQSSY